MVDLAELWKQIEFELNHAIVIVKFDRDDSILHGKLQEAILFFDKNEYQLSCDALDELGSAKVQMPEFHEALANAKRFMGLT